MLFSRSELAALEAEQLNGRNRPEDTRAEIISEYHQAIGRVFDLFSAAMREFPALLEACGKQLQPLPIRKQHFWSKTESEPFYLLMPLCTMGQRALHEYNLAVTSKGQLVSVCQVSYLQRDALRLPKYFESSRLFTRDDAVRESDHDVNFFPQHEAMSGDNTILYGVTRLSTVLATFAYQFHTKPGYVIAFERETYRPDASFIFTKQIPPDESLQRIKKYMVSLAKGKPALYLKD